VRAALWFRIGFLLLSGVLLFAAVQVRRDAEAEGDGPRGTRLTGVTGQRQTISVEVDELGRPRFLTTRIWTQCPGWPEQRLDWAPMVGVLASILWAHDSLRIREDKSFTYDNGDRGFASATLDGRSVGGRIEGSMRSVWRFERHGAEYMVCDSGYVPFVAGAGAEARLARVTPVRRPWTLYPAGPEHRRPRSLAQLGFVTRVDDTCGRTYADLREATRRARRRGGDYWRVERAYVRAREAQLRALLRLGDPPGNKAVYRRWIGNVDMRVELEHRQLDLISRGDLAAGASLEARLATLKARGNAAGLAFALKACTSNGPFGAPKS
jgi:hypothetical protein